MFGLLDEFKIPVIIVALSGAFLGGYYAKTKIVEAKQSKELLRIVQTYKENEQKSRVNVKELQTKLNKQEKVYNDLTKELRNVKISNSKCVISNDGTRLWNKSTKGSSHNVSKDTSRAVEETTTPSTITLEDLYTNKIENDAICNGLRKQIEAIIDWDKEVWHDSDSSGN